VFWTLILVALASFNLEADVQWPRWALLQFGLFTYLLYSLRHKYHWSLLFTGFITGMSCIIITNWRYNWLYMSKYKLSSIAFVQNTSGKAFMAMIILCVFLSQVSRQTLHKIFKGFYYLSIVHGLLWIAQHFFGFHLWSHSGFPEYGMFGNTSMGASINGIMLSSIFLKQNKYFRVLAIISLIYPIYLAQSSIGYLCAVTSLIVYCCFVLDINRLEKVYMIGGFLGITWFCGQFFDYQFNRFMKIDRWDIWKLYMNWWWENADHIFGTGFGSFSTFGPGIQIANDFQREHGGFYLWLHSDILQILFELGIVGLLSYLTLGFYSIKHAIKQKEYVLLGSLASYIVCMAGNYPTNMALFALLGLTMCFYINSRTDLR